MCVAVLILMSFFRATGWSIAAATIMAGKHQQQITGYLVAYTSAVELASGQCRQTLVLHIKGRANLERVHSYILIRYESSCSKLIPVEQLKPRQRLRLTLVRKGECDQTLDGLQYLKQISPTGEILRTPLLQRLALPEAKRMPMTAKLPCYALLGAWDKVG